MKARTHLWASILLLVALAAVMGCRDRAPAQQVATTPAAKLTAFQYIAHAEGVGATQLRFFADGVQVHETTAERQIRQEFKFTASSQRPIVTVQGHLDCEWVDVKVHVYPGLNPGIITLRVLDDLPREDILVDNRGREATTLRLGRREAAVEADRVDRVTLVASDCPEGAELALGSAPIGRLPKHPGRGAQRPTYFVDPTAKRCYERRHVAYGKPAKDEPKPVPPARFRGQKLHQLPERLGPEFMWGAAPEKVETVYLVGQSREGLVHKTLLREVRCTAGNEDDSW